MSLLSCYRSITAGVLRVHVLSVQASVTSRALLATACTALPLVTSRALELLWAPLDAECEVDLYEIGARCIVIFQNASELGSDLLSRRVTFLAGEKGTR